VAVDQDWCLDCGAAARTRIATTPRWRTPLALVAGVATLALAGLGFAFADLTADAGRLMPAPTTTVAPVVPPVNAAPTVGPTATSPAPVPPASQTNPTLTTPPATTTTSADPTGGSTAPPSG